MSTLDRIFVILVSVVVMSTAEPPVNTYLPARQPSSALSPKYGPPSTMYNAPGSGISRRPSVPSSQYGVPGVQTTRRVTPSFQRVPSPQYNVPSTQYGVPSTQYSGPSTQYGAPSGAGGYYSGGYSQGDDQSEPANYQFSYDVNAPEYNVEFGHQEARQGDDAKGVYYVLLPDGRKQRVDYTANLDGYKPVITYEDTGRLRGGYPSGAISGYTSNRNAGVPSALYLPSAGGPY